MDEAISSLQMSWYHSRASCCQERVKRRCLLPCVVSRRHTSVVVWDALLFEYAVRRRRTLPLLRVKAYSWTAGYSRTQSI